jgi:hypothetical protein
LYCAFFGVFARFVPDDTACMKIKEETAKPEKNRILLM